MLAAGVHETLRLYPVASILLVRQVFTLHWHSDFCVVVGGVDDIGSEKVNLQ